MNLYGPRQSADGIRTVRRNVVLIAEDIHEDDYLFRPSVGSRSVAEILIHIAFFSNFDYLFHEEEHVTTVEAFDFGQFLNDSESQEKRHHTKSKVIESLRNSGESWAEWVEFVPEPFLAETVAQRDGTFRTRFEMILGTRNTKCIILVSLRSPSGCSELSPISREPTRTQRSVNRNRNSN